MVTASGRCSAAPCRPPKHFNVTVGPGYSLYGLLASHVAVIVSSLATEVVYVQYLHIKRFSILTHGLLF